MELITAYIPSLMTLVIGVLVIGGLTTYVRKARPNDSRAFVIQLLSWGVALAVLVVLVVALPLTDSVRGQVLSLIGVVITGVIALASTTFVSNAMAGIMLQATQPFRPGDFIEVNGVFGRVTHRALVHTRIQNETRDFTTLPNLLLVTHPVTVLHREGTIIQADVSLGYDLHHIKAEKQLLAAAASAGLADPYVLITDLLDHAVLYRIAGFLENVKNPLSARSQLRREILDSLHGADIEITSPSVVAQRQQAGDSRSLPSERTGTRETDADAATQRVFDGADAPAEIEAIKAEIRATKEQMSEQSARLKSLARDLRPPEEATLARLEQKLTWLEGRLASLTSEG